MATSVEVAHEDEVMGNPSGVQRFQAVRPVARPRTRSAGLEHVGVVVPGGAINAETGYVRGHGTRIDAAGLRSTLAGVVERVNKLVAVRALRARYVPEVGDVVVGRVTGVRPRRWGVDIGAMSEAALLLSAVTLPGGLQRRRTHEDELNMRRFFEEGDLVSAEVQELWHDGAAALHTRSLRYGRLSGGALVVVQSALVKRAKKHFHVLACGVRAILGNNGYIFLDFPLSTDGADPNPDAAPESVAKGVDAHHRRIIARVANSIKALDGQFIAISPTTVADVYDASIEQDVSVVEMLRDDVARAICARAKDLREQA